MVGLPAPVLPALLDPAVLDVILSTLDRDLIPLTPPPPKLTSPVTAASTVSTSSSSNSTLSKDQQSTLLSAVGRYPAGHAPAAASSDELLEAYRVMQVSG